jgi:peptidoglycan/LPS O-acetylase OafA/YrhL
MGDPQKQVAPQRLNSLQSLRGLAAFLVLIFHIAHMQRAAIDTSNVVDKQLLTGFWDRGYVGVDLFFVISGFIMVYVTRDLGGSTKEVVRFLKSRVTRVYPLWWVFAGIMAIYFWVTYGIPADPFRISQPGELFPYLIKSFSLVPQKHLPVLGVGWTLIHEVYFYIVFAVILFLPRRFMIAALCIWTLTIGAGFYAGLAKPMVNSVPALMGSLLSLEFIGGAFIGLLVFRGETRLAAVSAILGLVGLLLGMVFYTENGLELVMWGRVAVFILPCLALVYGLTSLERLGKLEIPTLFVSIGDWSYSLYLSHILVLSALKRIYPKIMSMLPNSSSDPLSLGAPGPLDNVVWGFCGIVSCLVFAAFSYRYIERPLIAGSRRILKL